MSRKLNKAQLAEIKDLYVKDSFGSVRELAKLFNVSSEVIRWAVNYKNYREEQTKRNLKWQKENSARYKIILRRAVDRYYERNRMKMLIKMRERYYRTGGKEKSREYYWENKDKILARRKQQRSLNKLTKKK